MIRRPPRSTLFPYTTLFRSCIRSVEHAYTADGGLAILFGNLAPDGCVVKTAGVAEELWKFSGPARDRKSTRLNSSHANISYAVFCLKKTSLMNGCPTGDRKS